MVKIILLSVLQLNNILHKGPSQTWRYKQQVSAKCSAYQTTRHHNSKATVLIYTASCISLCSRMLARVQQLLARHRNVNCRSNSNGTKQRRKFCSRYFVLISQLEEFHVFVCLDQTVIDWLLRTITWTACHLTSQRLCMFNPRCESLNCYTIIVLKHETISKLVRKPKH